MTNFWNYLPCVWAFHSINISFSSPISSFDSPSLVVQEHTCFCLLALLDKPFNSVTSYQQRMESQSDRWMRNNAGSYTNIRNTHAISVFCTGVRLVWSREVDTRTTNAACIVHMYTPRSDYASKSAFYVGLESGSDTKSLFTTSRRWIGGLMLCDGVYRVYPDLQLQ